MDEQAAIAYIQATGTPIELWRLRAIISGEPAGEAVLESLFAGQNTDGGFPAFWSGHASSLDATCYHLAQAEQLGASPASSPVTKALAFLRHHQSENGCWEEDARLVQAAPPWARPGRLDARLYLTANCGFWLAVLNKPSPEAARAAGCLRDYFQPGGCLPTFHQAHWLALGLLTLLQEPAEILVQCLQSRLPALPASNLAWMLITLQIAGFPYGHRVVQQASALLAGWQQSAGNWESEDGPERNVHATLEALRALRYARVSR